MPLWTNTATGATNKPKFLPNDVNSKYDITKCIATNRGWEQRAGSSATGNGNVDADDEVLVAIGDLAGVTTSTGLKHPTITRARFGEASYTGGETITFNVTWDEAVKYVAGSLGTMVVVSTGTNITCTVSHIDDVAIADGLIGNTVRFTGTTVDENATLSIADDTALSDPDLVDALGANDALSGADATTITAAVKAASGYSTRTVTAS